MWSVISHTGLPVFEGNKWECKQFVKHAYSVGEYPDGWFNIVKSKDVNKF